MTLGSPCECATSAAGSDAADSRCPPVAVSSFAAGRELARAQRRPARHPEARNAVEEPRSRGLTRWRLRWFRGRRPRLWEPLAGSTGRTRANLLELALASLLLLSSPERVERHVVFIHGVRFSNRSTPWLSSGSSPTLWPPWLTDDIPGLAAWSIQHDSAPSLWRGHAMSLVDRANNLLPLLLAEPRLAKGDISFVAHSFGGLILQQLLRVARDRFAAEPNVAAFLRRVTRIAFLGTPHHGATLATWTRILRLLVRPSSAVKALARNDPNLRGLNQSFRRYILDTGTSVQTFVETKNTFLIKVVASDSADPGLPSYPWVARFCSTLSMTVVLASGWPAMVCRRLSDREPVAFGSVGASVKKCFR